jgi:hypothetical protein
MLPHRLLIGIALLWGFAANSALAGLPSCFPPVEVAHAKIVRVERNGVLVLSDGRAAKLEGILLPAGAADHTPGFLADQAIAKLSALATGHSMVLAADVPKEDRYGRLRAEAFLSNTSDERWLQRALLQAGLARVSPLPDRSECTEELYAAEQHARAQKLGLWSLDAYRLRAPDQLGGEGGTFQIVEGTIGAVSSAGGRVYLQFGRDRRSDFAAVLTADDLKTFRRIGVDPFGYQNRTVRLRGWIDHTRAPEMEIATPAAIEVLETPDLRGSIATSR